MEQEHNDGLSSRLRQREEELGDAALLMTETKEDLKALRDQAKKANDVSYLHRPRDTFVGLTMLRTNSSFSVLVPLLKL